MAGNNTSDLEFGTISEGEENSSFPLLLTLSLSCLIVYLCAWVGLSINKYWGKMEPGHIIMINLLVDNALILLGTLFTQINVLFSGSISVCTCLLFLDTWMKVARFFGFILSETNRFLALYWNIHYKDRVTNDTAKLVIFVLKSISLVVTLICPCFCFSWMSRYKVYESPKE